MNVNEKKGNIDHDHDDDGDGDDVVKEYKRKEAEERKEDEKKQTLRRNIL